MIEALDLLSEDEILQQCRAAVSDLKAVLILNRAAHVGGQECVIVGHIVLGQEFLCRGGGIVGSCVATFKLTGHVRTRRTGNANEAGKGEGAHRVANCQVSTQISNSQRDLVVSGKEGQEGEGKQQGTYRTHQFAMG